MATGDGDDHGDKAGDEAVDCAGADFVEDGFFGVAEFDFFEGDAADDNGEGLGGGVSAHAGDDWKVGGEDDIFGDRFVKESDDEGGEKCGSEVEDKPFITMLDFSEGGVEDVFFFVDAGEFIEGFAGLAADKSEDVIGIKNTDDAFSFVDEGNFFVGVFDEDFGDFTTGFVVSQVGNWF